MTPEKCPACGTKLRPDMLACPNCPMSFPEQIGPKRVDNPLKQSPYYKFLFPAIFFGAIGAMVWYLGMGLMRLGLANNQIENGNLFGAPRPVVSAPPSPKKDDSSASSAETASEAPPVEEGEMVVISHHDENGTPIGAPAKRAPAKPAPAKPAPAKPARAAKAPIEWRLRGAVYDLTTLKPLAFCTLLFKDEESGRSIKTQTDSSGRYRAIVPPLNYGRGYSVTLQKSGYAPNYLDLGVQGVRQMPAGERENMARNLSATLAEAPATVASASEKPLVTDFYLAPRL